MSILMRAQGAPDALTDAARSALQRLSPTFPIYRLMPMRELRRVAAWQERFFGNLMAVFATMAMLLACLGVHALISYSVGRRLREIGIRVALGASPGVVVTTLLREALKVGATGLLAGVALAAAIARTLVSTLYGVTVDAWVFASMACPLGLAILLATWWPARRASRIDAIAALKVE
jgi:ABC-type antimicrobial peptide transport system permease subunit